jgi:hypothetical protein
MTIIEQGGGALGGAIARWTGYGLSFAGFLLPLVPARYGGQALAAAALILPAAVFALLLVSPEAFAQTLRGTRTRTISVILLFPSFMLFVGTLNAGVIDAHFALLPGAVCAVIAVLLGLGAARRPMPGGLVAAIVFLALFGAGYGYGGLVYADTRLDASPGQLFQAQVLARWTSFGRGGETYHLTLAPWGPVSRSLSVITSRATYMALNPGDTACMTLRPGALGMEWYQTGLCNPG